MTTVTVADVDIALRRQPLMREFTPAQFDQLMNIGWKVMIPWGLVNFVLVAAWMEFGEPSWSMAVVGWPALFICWLAAVAFDPTAGYRKNAHEI